MPLFRSDAFFAWVFSSWTNSHHNADNTAAAAVQIAGIWPIGLKVNFVSDQMALFVTFFLSPSLSLSFTQNIYSLFAF